MSSGFSPFSFEPKHALEPLTSAVLASIHAATTALGLPYFLAGATARDIWLVNIFGLPPGRATRDIDFGVAVQNWEQFACLKAGLVRTGDFIRDAKQEQRGAVPVDLVPFGGIASAANTIAWPPDQNIKMNVAGFAEAYESSLRFEIAGALHIPSPFPASPH
jgi:predicted nucleotidyltransferase